MFGPVVGKKARRGVERSGKSSGTRIVPRSLKNEYSEKCLNLMLQLMRTQQKYEGNRVGAGNFDDLVSNSNGKICFTLFSVLLISNFELAVVGDVRVFHIFKNVLIVIANGVYERFFAGMSPFRNPLNRLMFSSFWMM